MPNIPFLLLAAARRRGLLAREARGGRAGRRPVRRDRAGRDAGAERELSWDEIRPVDPLGLEVGYRLIALVDRNQGGDLLARLKGVRRKLTQDLGFLVPPCTCATTSNWRRATASRARRAGGERRAPPDRELALDPGRVFGPLDGIPQGPAFGLDAFWIPPSRARTPNRWATPWSTPPPWSPPIFPSSCARALPNCSATRKCSTCCPPRTQRAEARRRFDARRCRSAVVKVLQSLLAERVPVRKCARSSKRCWSTARTQDPGVSHPRPRGARPLDRARNLRAPRRAARHYSRPVARAAAARRREDRRGRRAELRAEPRRSPARRAARGRATTGAAQSIRRCCSCRPFPCGLGSHGSCATVCRILRCSRTARCRTTNRYE